MHKSTQPSRQCVNAEQEVNLTVGTMRRKKLIVKRANDTILRLYECIVILQLEYCIHLQSLPEIGH